MTVFSPEQQFFSDRRLSPGVLRLLLEAGGELIRLPWRILAAVVLARTRQDEMRRLIFGPGGGSVPPRTGPSQAEGS